MSKSEEQRRTTKVIAHCAKDTLLRKFPDEFVEKRIVIRNHHGDELLNSGYYEYGDKDKMLITLANQIDGYSVEIVEQKKSHINYVKIDGRDYSLSYVSERKCAVVVNSNPKYADQDEHYERVDKVIAALAEADVSLLEGQCEVTVTTRC